MKITESYLLEYHRLRLLGVSPLVATGLLMARPARFGLGVSWRACVVFPLFIVGALTASVWFFLPSDQVSEVVSILLRDAGLMNQIVVCLLLAGGMFEGMRFVWNMNASLEKPVVCAVTAGEGRCVRRYRHQGDKQQ